MYGAEVSPDTVLKVKCSQRGPKKQADNGMVYASHAYLPFNIPGYATCAYEIYEQLGQAPSAVVVPVGQGGYFLASVEDFDPFKMWKNPKNASAHREQASACAPFIVRNSMGLVGLNFVTEGRTLAEGVKNF